MSVVASLSTSLILVRVAPSAEAVLDVLGAEQGLEDAGVLAAQQARGGDVQPQSARRKRR